MNAEPELTVVMTTYNRASILNETLKSMAQIQRKNLKVDFVIVDNNSTDNTKEIISKWNASLPITYLFESEPGQNPARNKALSEANFGKIIVFTDDDVKPNDNWFSAIVYACEQWPEYSVFGGKIYPIWPAETLLPKWAQENSIQSFGFAVHDYKEHQCVYEINDYPFSPNFWVRRSIFKDFQKFDNKIEWHPKNRIMATETVFFRDLVAKGHRIVYCPEAVVGHKINPEQLTLMNILKRSYSCGRGLAHIRSFCRSDMLKKTPLLWYAMRYAAISKIGLKLTGSFLPLAFDNPRQSIEAFQWLGYNMELLNLAQNFK